MIKTMYDEVLVETVRDNIRKFLEYKRDFIPPHSTDTVRIEDIVTFSNVGRIKIKYGLLRKLDRLFRDVHLPVVMIYSYGSSPDGWNYLLDIHKSSLDKLEQALSTEWVEKVASCLYLVD